MNILSIKMVFVALTSAPFDTNNSTIDKWPFSKAIRRGFSMKKSGYYVKKFNIITRIKMEKI